MKNAKKKSKNALIATGFIVGSIVAAVLLVGSRERPSRSAPPVRAPSVTTVEVQKLVGPMKVRGSGTVRPKAEIDLAPQVGGRVVFVSPSLVSGGRVSAGELLVRIEGADYANALMQARAQVAQDSVTVLESLEEARIAQAEFEQFRQRQRRMAPPASAEGAEVPIEPEASLLALRRPQLQAAEATLARSQAQMADAELALARTELRAPFDGVVRTETVDVGAFAVPGQPLARLLSTEEVEVKIPLSDDDAALLPGIWNREREGVDPLSANVIARFGRSFFRWEGYVHRAEAALDEETRTIDVVVRVSEPFVGGTPMEESADDPAGGAIEPPPLLIGQFVDVELEGSEGEYLVVPRRAVRPGNEVWIVEEDRIRIVPVRVFQYGEGQAFLTGDIEAGQRVVIEGISLATDGMEIQDRTAAAEAQNGGRDQS